jgi:uncharacterized protein YigE (DUF2233 family)
MIQNLVFNLAPFFPSSPRSAAGPIDLTEGTVQGIDYDHAVVAPGKLDISLVDQAQLQSGPQCQKTCLIFNGGFFEPDGTPSGLLIAGGTVSAPFSRRSLLSGIFAVKNGAFQIIRSGDYVSDPGISFAVQNGPLLVEPGGSFGIVKNSATRQLRTVIALDRAGSAHIIVFKTPVSLFASQFLVARLVKNLSSALNLDGGPSSYIYYNDGKNKVEFGDRSVPAYFLKINLQ